MAAQWQKVRVGFSFSSSPGAPGVLLKQPPPLPQVSVTASPKHDSAAPIWLRISAGSEKLTQAQSDDDYFAEFAGMFDQHIKIICTASRHSGPSMNSGWP